MEREDIKINIPAPAAEILDKLHENGFEAYVVGGCVRDSILGRRPGDWDITTSARPEQVKSIFGRTIDTGIQHGTVTVMINKEGFEVTTYRIDGEYEDGRHPKDVTFTASLIEDLKRRDFTINAMAYSYEDGLIDEFDGLLDIEKKTIRCVGDPKERFTEDALRMMRAVRFAAQLDYDIEEKTRAAITELAPTLSRISAERVQVELVKLLTSDNPGKIRELYETGLTGVFMPEFDKCFETPQNNPHHAYNVGEHIIKTVEAIEPNKVLRLTMLFHDIEKPSCRTTDAEGVDHFIGHAEKSAETAYAVLRRLKFDRDTMDDVKKLILVHDWRFPAEKKNVRRAANKIGTELFPMFLKIKRADTIAQSSYRQDEKFDWIQKISDLYDEIRNDGECLSLKDLSVNGKDLIALGIKPGRELGDILANMLADVLEEPSHNSREYLLDETNLAGFRKGKD
ncbi:tRNA nucleotidyltransferase (CCA-adding enzyme) [Butyrivibrio sp. INlla16]|nr:CCA tRNA nucleotidyltransferase [Butyrivibrio sp. INlla16]SDB65402.1 tRNA nucleotidyltransferase (CCA-adding enzyme) [Butyrivibrio sp. INlla16]